MSQIEDFGIQTVEAVTCLIKGNNYMQALVVLYSAIDTLAWANRVEGDVTKNDFCNWVTSYMQPELRLECTPDDLYAARCGLVHSSCAESNMSRTGKASEIWYVTAKKSATLLSAVAQKNANVKVVSTTDLIAEFTFGIENFILELKGDLKRQQLVTERIRRWLTFMPISPVMEALESQS